MLGLFKVVVVVCVIAVVGGLATHWVKDKATTGFRHAFDVSLPSEVAGHPWAPLSHGKPDAAARVRFVDGTVRSVRCHAELGTYTAQVDHTFTFERSSTPLRAGCPGRRLAASLRHAIRVDVATSSGVDTLSFTGPHGHTVATLRGRHQ